ncbi:Patellin-4 [Dichanthelium oligosanthes]|uniref:Patellin-4 n=1 Tax=Dichanthelium oligosanthes TaxID=888268 RepID=A0A1E5US56_9POAL|nr:Patellin-4 [Dichanthelium oligosanthes]
MAVEAVSGNGGEAVAPAKEVSTKEQAVAVTKNASFREESNFLDDLKESERKALSELRDKLEAAILEGKLFDDGKPEVKEKEEGKKKADKAAPEEKKEEEEGKEDPKAEEKNDDEDGKKEAEAEDKEEEEESKEEAEKEAEEKEGKKEEEAKEEEAGEGEKVAATEEEKSAETPAVVVDKDIALWGVPLLPSKGDEATDVVLLKFLRARDFKAGAAFEMLRRTLCWRRDWTGFTADADADADLPEELAGACYLDGADREGHPVCYNALGVFAGDAVYKKALGTEEGKARFLRWRVRSMERHVAELDFKPSGAASLLQVTDLKNSPGPAKKDFRVAVKQVLDLFQDNYPELVARNILINVPFWYYAFSTLFYPFLTQRTKSKFVIARPSKVTETLLKYIPIEAIPVKYGGLKREGDTEFSADVGEVTELTVKGSSTETIEIEATEADATLTWDLTVLGWEVNYKEEFVPADESSYTIIVRKGKKMGAGEEAVRNSFRAGELGKVVLTVENTSSRKKKVLFRHKAKSSCAKKC